MTLHPYKGYFVSGKALIVHPFSPDWYVGGSVDTPGRLGSIVGGDALRDAFVNDRAAWAGGMVRTGASQDCRG